MQLSAILESREEEEGLLTKTETRKMTMVTKKTFSHLGNQVYLFPDVIRIAQTERSTFVLLTCNISSWVDFGDGAKSTSLTPSRPTQGLGDLFSQTPKP